MSGADPAFILHPSSHILLGKGREECGEMTGGNRKGKGVGNLVIRLSKSQTEGVLGRNGKCTPTGTKGPYKNDL